MDSPLDVRLDAFEGPLDLLLHLIREHKIDIFNIPIAEITERYLQYLEAMKQLDLDISGEFLVMAATLLYIKSKMLLPVEEEDIEDEDSMDPRDELVQKLLEYQSFKEAARELGMLAKERSQVYTRQISESVSHVLAVEANDAEFNATLYDLIQAFSRVLKEKTEDRIHEVYEEVITVEEMVDSIRVLINTQEALSFLSLFEKRKTKNAVIATFFAILELCKQKEIRVEQSNMFGDITLRKVA